MEAVSVFESLLSVHQRTWLHCTIIIIVIIRTAVTTQNPAHGSHPENMKGRILLTISAPIHGQG
jgi:hypothetical protein